MSYLSRLYNHRNAQSAEGKDKPFFAKKQKENDTTKRNAFFQAKLEVNKPGDKYEQEADAVASKVVGNKTANAERPSVQRLSTEDETKMPSTNDGRMAEDKRIQEKSMVQKTGTPDKEKEKPIVQKMNADPEKEKKKGIQKMELPEKKKEEGVPAAVQKMGVPEKEKEKPGVQKMSADPEKEKMKGIQKMELPEKKKEEGKTPPIQKLSVPEKEKEKPAIRKMDGSMKEEKDKTTTAAIQRKPGDVAATASPKVASAIKDKSGKGNSLPKKTLQEMNTSFGMDFSNVRIHNDGEAAKLNQELQAQAFTHGRDIYFNKGKFDPDSSVGKFLLAHELTHVVQQGSGQIISKSEDTTDMAQNSGCTSTTRVKCPGSVNQFSRLGYVGLMTLTNVGSCPLYIHSLDAQGNNLDPTASFLIQPGESRIYNSATDATNTAVVCHNNCAGEGMIKHPFNCA